MKAETSLEQEDQPLKPVSRQRLMIILGPQQLETHGQLVSRRGYGSETPRRDHVAAC